MRRDILTAVPTGFTADGALDLAASRAIFEHVAHAGNEGAFVLGTTGEFPAVDDVEFALLVEPALEVLDPVTRVVVHVGQPSARQAVERVRLAKAAGASEFAALTPYYLPVSQDSILGYFAQVSEAVADGVLYAYLYPARSGNPVAPQTLAAIAALPNVAGAKLSELSLADIAAYRDVVPADFLLYTGADRDLVAAGAVGAQGVVSGVSSVLPKPFRRLAAAAATGDLATIAEAQAAVDDVVAVVGGDMARMKAAYRIMGVADTHCRMALAGPDAAALSEIERVVESYA